MGECRFEGQIATQGPMSAMERNGAQGLARAHRVFDAALIHIMGSVSDGKDDRWVKPDNGALSNRSPQKRPAIR